MKKVAVVIPCYKCKKHILGVISSCPEVVSRIYVVDDCCPEGTGEFVKESSHDTRVAVLFQPQNSGVGGAVMAGYKAAIKDGMDILVKIDGDGQMDPRLISNFIRPLQRGLADYAKGNRFWNVDDVRSMPKVRLFGNAVLSFMNKLSSGYWNVFDPTNGYTAITREVARELPFEKISKRYFFETDLLFRLATMRAVVVDVPMKARYGDEISGLNIRNILFEFMRKHATNFAKRVFYNYFIRDFSLASLELLLSLALLGFGLIFGGSTWCRVVHTGIAASSGTVMLAALPIFVGSELLISFFNYDINSVPKNPITENLKDKS